MGNDFYERRKMGVYAAVALRASHGALRPARGFRGMHIPSRTRQGFAFLLSKLLPDRGGRVADLVHCFLKLLAAHAEMLGPITDLMFFVHRDFAAVG